MGKNLKSLGRWFKHEENVPRERGGSHAMHRRRARCQLHRGTLPLAWHPWPKGPRWGYCPTGAVPGHMPTPGDAEQCHVPTPQCPPSLVGMQGACSRLPEAGKADLLSLIIISDAYQGSLQTWFN